MNPSSIKNLSLALGVTGFALMLACSFATQTSPPSPEAQAIPADYLGRNVKVESNVIRAGAASSVAKHFVTTNSNGQTITTWRRTSSWDLGGDPQSSEPELVESSSMPGYLSIPGMISVETIQAGEYWQTGIQEVVPPPEGSSGEPQKMAEAIMAESNDSNPNNKSKRWWLTSQYLRLRSDTPLSIDIKRHFLVRIWGTSLYNIGPSNMTHSSFEENQIESYKALTLTLPAGALLGEEQVVPITGSGDYGRWADIHTIGFAIPDVPSSRPHGEVLVLPLPGGDPMEEPIEDNPSGPTPSSPPASPPPGTDFTDRQLAHATELRVAKLENSLLPHPIDPDAPHEIWPSLDEDSFRITFTGLRSDKIHFIELETRNADGTVCDGPKEIQLRPPSPDKPHLNFWATPLMVLVSDDEDNLAPVAVLANGVTHRYPAGHPERRTYTHKVTLGGKVVVKSLRTEGSSAVPFENLERQVKIHARFNAKIGILSDVHPSVAAVRQKAEEEVVVANERLAQIGAVLDVEYIDIPLSSTGLSSSNFFQSELPNAPNTSESRIAATIPTVKASDIHVFYCNRLKKPTNDGTDRDINGYTFRPPSGKAHRVFINSVNHTIFTMVHEIVHTAEKYRGHYVGSTPKEVDRDYDDPTALPYKLQHNLMKRATDNNKHHNSGKRIFKKQEEQIFKKATR
ncbi:hypothetical protein FEM03_17860 [Phragmitibacter flavus]|uniref:Lysine-specific metallo-endopeptidase domain-containing protein n=1 Tax=Phragmitibacter flavus TaxID=2576071 RepID=A0A5R8KB09_9BACT|nr:hypothetical protein [Phragmitibacter flavus]TLD69502.1 hypothetical protein FEM03_17860 [Phragmitibacter flavus]